MTSQPIDQPSIPSGGIDYETLLGALLLIDVHSVEAHVPTVYSTPGKESPAVRADVVVIDGAHAGDKHEDVLIFPKVLQSQLNRKVGSRILGRLTQGIAKPGQNPAWRLDPSTAADLAAANAALARVQPKPLASAEPPF